jgi:hypothetical protein
MDEKELEKIRQLFAAGLEKLTGGIIEGRNQWDQFVQSQDPQTAEVLQELTAFSQLWEYISSQGTRLPSDVLESLQGIRMMPVHERPEAYRKLNERLLASVKAEQSGPSGDHQHATDSSSNGKVRRCH